VFVSSTAVLLGVVWTSPRIRLAQGPQSGEVTNTLAAYQHLPFLGALSSHMPQGVTPLKGKMCEFARVVLGSGCLLVNLGLLYLQHLHLQASHYVQQYGFGVTVAALSHLWLIFLLLIDSEIGFVGALYLIVSFSYFYCLFYISDFDHQVLTLQTGVIDDLEKSLTDKAPLLLFFCASVCDLGQFFYGVGMVLDRRHSVFSKSLQLVSSIQRGLKMWPTLGPSA